MPRYYCDYCDTHLTHDSPSVRKQHCAGYKHKANVRQYYQQFEEQQTQSLIDQKVKEHLGQTAAAALAHQQVGGAVYSHLTTLGGQYKPIASPGLLRPPALASARPPVLAPPGPSGYGSGAPPTFRPPIALPLGSASTQYYSSNGPAQLQLATSNGAPQYSVNNSSSSHSYSSSLGSQSQYTLGINSLPAQYQSSSGGSQEQQYPNGPARVSSASTYNQGSVYQRFQILSEGIGLFEWSSPRRLH